MFFNGVQKKNFGYTSFIYSGVDKACSKNNTNSYYTSPTINWRLRGKKYCYCSIRLETQYKDNEIFLDYEITVLFFKKFSFK